MLDIGKRLNLLRKARGLSQGDIEKETGLLRCYTSRVENGHTMPSLKTLEKYAAALGVELYQLLYAGEPEAVGVLTLAEPERRIVELMRKVSSTDRRTLLEVAERLGALHSAPAAR